ncbi:hypothetical protein BKA82DRAFT_30109 [Pisolithus tinctorius]|uniref:Uncharacterized protein n=1 Tax=Pisolithus tinctorius Marx 270 TaxID=870435 RepID=A0A0C3NXI5_PISTI|nr:hypothetical protein BKA82DRAFT_30109 [Pisolithus tinctorius]KIN99843.1 hypothetical protein M404DRAFT_30109 [Pisolithus tinctorius Marx 270]
MSTANTSTFILAQLTNNIQPVITAENAKQMVKEAARVTMQELKGLWGQDSTHWHKVAQLVWAQLGMVHTVVQHLPPVFEIPPHLIAIDMHMVDLAIIQVMQMWPPFNQMMTAQEANVKDHPWYRLHHQPKSHPYYKIMEELTGPSLRAEHQAQPVDKGKGKELGTEESQGIQLPVEIITLSWLSQSWSHARSIATDPPISPAPTTTTSADDLCHCDEYQEEVTVLKQENADMRWEIEVTHTELATLHQVVDAIHNHLFLAPDMLNHPLVPFHATSNPTLVPHMPVMVELGTTTGVVEVQSSQSGSRQESTEPPPASFEGGAGLEVPPSNVKPVHGPAGGLAISITLPPPAVGSAPGQEGRMEVD